MSALPDVEVRASARRRTSLTAFREDGRVVVVVPAHLSARQRNALVPDLVQRFLAKEVKRTPPRGDLELTAHAQRLFVQYLATAASGPMPNFGVRWVANQTTRWGSCSPSTGEIRLTHRLQGMPTWVVDFVLVHELAHLIEHDHTSRFHQLERRYPHADRAKAFLEGVDFARRHLGAN